jgi:hypothetical protein
MLASNWALSRSRCVSKGSVCVSACDTCICVDGVYRHYGCDCHCAHRGTDGAQVQAAAIAATAVPPQFRAVDIGTVVGHAKQEATLKVASYITHYSRTCRAANEAWPDASQVWKTWWASMAQLHATDHWLNCHQACACFLWYALCRQRAAGPVTKRDKSLRWWDIQQNSAKPAGITELAKIAINAYTVSSQFRKRLFASVLFMRDSDAESWNHHLRIWCARASLP